MAARDFMAAGAAEAILAAGKLMGRHRPGPGDAGWGADSELILIGKVAGLRDLLETLHAGSEKRRSIKLTRYRRWHAEQAEPSIGPYALGSDEWPGLAKLVEECAELLCELGDPDPSSTGLDWEAADVLAACDFFIEQYEERVATHLLVVSVALDDEVPSMVSASCQRCGKTWGTDVTSHDDVARYVSELREERCESLHRPARPLPEAT